jgi:hypothetical protein
MCLFQPALTQRAAMLLPTVVLLAGLAACGDDEAIPDDGEADAAVDLPDAATTPDADPRLLSSQGLYADIGAKTVVPGALEYAPAHALWSDAAAKRRWIILPPGSTIDTSDMDHWKFPVGTKLFKEFALEGKLLETRLIEIRPDDTFFAGAFIWNEAQTEATLSLGGQDNVLGTQHDVPTQNRCGTCHKGEPGFVLGFSALQLAKESPAAGEVTLESVKDRLSSPPATAPKFPGDATARAAFGYLHANCGHCHNPSGTANLDTCVEDPQTGALSECMLLRWSVADGDKATGQSAPELSLINQSTHTNQFPKTTRVEPGDSGMSAIFVRTNQRGSNAQMPPRFATEVVDDTGAAAIKAWIDALTP